MRGILVVLIVAGLGCTKPQVANKCPETQGVRCMTTPQCAEDPERGCMVCRCAAPAGEDGRERPPYGGGGE